MAKKEPVITLSRESMEARYSGGRIILMTAIVLTVINVIFVLMDSTQYLLFSVAAAYYMVAFGKGMDNSFTTGDWSVTGTYTITSLVLALVILALYLLAWYKSKTNRRWMTVGLVLFVLDTLILLWVALVVFTNPGSNIIDLCIHLWILFIMFRAVSNGKKIQYLDEEEARLARETGQAPDSAESQDVPDSEQ